MSLLVLAYPEPAPDDRAWIERIRAAHDPRACKRLADALDVVTREEGAVRTVARLPLG